MRIVLDTNVWISGLILPKSNAGIILDAWKNGQYTIVCSDPILKEMERVLQYPKIAKRLNLDDVKLRQYLDLLIFFTEHVNVQKELVIVENDPDDSLILTTLIASKANWLITGDDELLKLKDAYPILSIKEFCDLIEGC